MSLRKIIFAVVLVQILTLMWSQVVAADSPYDLDITFNQTGIVTNTNFSGWALTVQTDGEIVVGGSSGGAALIRYDSAGEIDPSFGNMGTVNIPLSGLVQATAIQTDSGKIVSVISNLSKGEYYLTRHTVTGTLDTSFNTTGIVTLPVKTSLEVDADVAFQPGENKIVAAVGTGTNNETIIIRYDNSGNLDTTFNNGAGMITNTLGLITKVAPSLLIDANEKIMVTGSVIGAVNVGNGCCFVTRYNDDDLDTGFNGTGTVTDTLHGGHSIAIQTDGKIVSAGSFFFDSDDNPDFSVVRYNSDGSLDTSFNNNTGVATVDIGGGEGGGASVAIQSDGKIVVGGYFKESSADNYSFIVIRFDENGDIDESWNDIGYVMTPVDGAVYNPRLVIQPDGKILIADTQYPASGVELIMARYVGIDMSEIYLPIVLK